MQQGLYQTLTDLEADLKYVKAEYLNQVQQNFGVAKDNIQV